VSIESLKALQTRIREATGPDRELDDEICKTFDQPIRWGGGSHPYTSDPDGLGACVALMREVLPGACLDFSIVDGDCAIATTYLPPSYRMSLASEHPCATNAILLAIVSARIAELEAKEKADA
jgi:hypothetical protein